MTDTGHYLICDDCGHQMNIDFFDEKWIGTPCPDCGADVLTKSDLETGRAIEALLNALGVKISPNASTMTSVFINPHNNQIKLEFYSEKGNFNER